mmetsp:Transcript_29980/g.46990  ORF Transcript_29980/g.46990 Transcript_29980/m.46990 type:complete len:111 (+) Transcript_29980:172-504(+)
MLKIKTGNIFTAQLIPISTSAVTNKLTVVKIISPRTILTRSTPLIPLTIAQNPINNALKMMTTKPRPQQINGRKKSIIPTVIIVLFSPEFNPTTHRIKPTGDRRNIPHDP